MRLSFKLLIILAITSCLCMVAHASSQRIAPPPPRYTVQSPPPPPPGYVPPETTPGTLPQTPYPRYRTRDGYTGSHASTPELEPFEKLSPPPNYPIDVTPERRQRQRISEDYEEDFIMQPFDDRPVVSRAMADNLIRFMRSINSLRNLNQDPTNEARLRHIFDIGHISSEMLGLLRYPPITRFVAGHRDSMTYYDRAEGRVEYRQYGGFDNRLTGLVKHRGRNDIYLDLAFQGRGRRRNHIRAEVSRSGTWEATFYAYGWDRYGHLWKIQGKVENVFVHSDGMPTGGTITLQGADPRGTAVELIFEFPVRVDDEFERRPESLRHREGQPVSIRGR